MQLWPDEDDPQRTHLERGVLLVVFVAFVVWALVQVGFFD